MSFLSLVCHVPHFMGIGPLLLNCQLEKKKRTRSKVSCPEPPHVNIQTHSHKESVACGLVNKTERHVAECVNVHWLEKPDEIFSPHFRVLGPLLSCSIGILLRQ